MATAENVEYEVDGKAVSKLKVDELKVELEKRGLKKSGVKKELQERLIEYLRTHSDNSGSSDVQSSSPTTNDKETSGYSGTDTEALSGQGHSQESEHEVPKDICDEDNIDKEEGSNLTENIDPNVTNKDTTEHEDGEISVEDKSEEKKDKKLNNPEKKRRISLTRETSSTNPVPGGRKRKWNSSSGKTKSSVVISTGSLKGLIPGVQLASTPALEAVMDLNDDKEDEETEKEKDEKEKDDKEKEHENETEDNEDKEEEKVLNKKTRIVQIEDTKKVTLNPTTEVEIENNDMDVSQEQQSEDMATGPASRNEDLSSTPSSETNFKAKRAISPPRLPLSQVVHVINLVRPFTQPQLNQLLSLYGTLVEGGFWINKIKSHCYVTYSCVDEAKSARDALHGQRWPATSPKILKVDFGDEEQMLEDTEGMLGKKKEVVVEKEDEKENENENEKDNENEKENEKEKDKEKHKGKETRRHKEKKEQKPKEESNAANLLDKLFRKTTAQPCIYWLPLTKEQILKKESERDERRKQRQQAVQEEEKRRDERLKGKEKERESTREREKFREQKPSRDNRVTSPAPKSRAAARSGSPDGKNRSRSRSKDNAAPRRDDRKR